MRATRFTEIHTYAVHTHTHTHVCIDLCVCVCTFPFRSRRRARRGAPIEPAAGSPSVKCATLFQGGKKGGRAGDESGEKFFVLISRTLASSCTSRLTEPILFLFLLTPLDLRFVVWPFCVAQWRNRVDGMLLNFFFSLISMIG